MSRAHAKLMLADDELYIENLSNTNFTYTVIIIIIIIISAVLAVVCIAVILIVRKKSSRKE